MGTPENTRLKTESRAWGNTQAKTLAPTARGSRAQLAPTARDREHSSLLQQEVPGVLPSAGEVSEPRPYSVKLHPAHNKFSE